TRQVAAWPGKTGDKSKPDRGFGAEEDDGGRRGRRLGRERHRRAAARDDDSDTSASQFSRQCPQPIALIFGPPVSNVHVLIFDIPGVFEALEKSTQTGRQRVRRPGIDKPNHRHWSLLRLPLERPHNRRATEQRDELAASDHSMTSSARVSSE